MKADKNFRIHQNTKRMLCTIFDSHRRGEFKRAMIDAQLTAERVQRRSASSRTTENE